MIEKKFRSGIIQVIISLAFVLPILLTTSCKPQYDTPFPISDVDVASEDQLDAPQISRVMTAGNLEGKRNTINWIAPRHDRYASGLITTDKEKINGKNVKYYVSELSRRPDDDRIFYIIKRAERKPGENIYDIPMDRFVEIGRAEEGENQYVDNDTESSLVLYAAFHKEVKEIERETTRKLDEEGWKYIYLDTPETEQKVAELEAEGWEVDSTVIDIRKYVLVRDTEKKMLKRDTVNGKDTVKTQDELVELQKQHWTLLGSTPDAHVLRRQMGSYKDVSEGKAYVYIVGISVNGKEAYSDPSLPVASTTGIYRYDRTIGLVLVLIFVISSAYYIISAKRGKEFYIRPIAGIKAVEEAVGRAAEMGRTCMFLPGIGGVSGPATLASMAILGKIAEKTAEYDTGILMPNYDVFVLQVAQEVIKESYLRSGRPDAYRQDMAFFMSDRQFAYAGGVSGLMAREKPAAVFLLGTFYAESLLLAEAAANVGAIQIAGTDMDHQLPFFVTACDYTLIGEELYAAGAYMGRDPRLIGTLKAQDFFKGIAVVLIIALLIGGLISAFCDNVVLNYLFRTLFDNDFNLPVSGS